MTDSQTNGDDRIEAAIGETLIERDETVAVAESLTGGQVASRLIAVPGASAYVDRAVIAYSNQSKQQLLAVPREALDADGAVSERVAAAMARGIRDTAGTTWGVSTTGIAGPTGGTENKPVGLVYVAVAYAGPWGSERSFVQTERHVCDGSRNEITEQSVAHALALLAATIESVESCSEKAEEGRRENDSVGRDDFDH